MESERERVRLTHIPVPLQAFFDSGLHLQAEKFHFHTPSCCSQTEARQTKEIIIKSPPHQFQHFPLGYLSGRPTCICCKDKISGAIVAEGGPAGGVVKNELTGVQTGN